MAIFKSRVFLKMFISCVLILVFPVVVLGGVNYYNTSQIVNGQLLKMNMATVDRVRDSYDRMFRDLHDMTTMIGDLPWLTRITQMSSIDFDRIDVNDMTNIVKQLRVHKFSSPYIRNITVVLRKGDLVIDCDTTYDKAHYWNVKYTFDDSRFSGRQLDWSSLSATFINKLTIHYYGNTTDYSMLYARPVSATGATGGEPAALILVHLDESKMKEALDDYSIGENTMVYAMKPDGSDFFSEDTVASSPIAGLHIQNGDSGSGQAALGSERFHYYFTVSAYNGLRYAAVADTKSVMVQVDAIKRTTALLAVCSVLAGFALSYAAAASNYRPIRRLTERIKIPWLAGSDHNEFDRIEQGIRQLDSEREMLNRNLEEHLPIVRNNTLLRIVKGIEHGDELEQGLTKFGIMWDSSMFCVAVIESEAMDNMRSTEPFTENELDVAIVKGLQSYLADIGIYCDVVEFESSTYAAICYDGFAGTGILKKAVTDWIEQMRVRLSSRLELGFACGIGSVVHDAGDIHRSYKEALEALAYKFRQTQADVTMYEDIADQSKHNVAFSAEHELRLVQAAKTGDFIKTEVYIDELLRIHTDGQPLNRETAMYVLTKLLSAAVQASEELGMPWTDTLSYADLHRQRSYEEAVAYIKSVYRTLCQCVEGEKRYVNEKQAKLVVGYIDEHFASEDISLTLLSERFSCSGVYVSRLIKEYAGCNFVEYVNLKRIEKAKALLLSTDMLVKDIAFAVGYDHDITFRRIFKKYEEITPGEYREGLSRADGAQQLD
ncbi:helix-turn-helix domain-containing protein [Paenibacillus contaminans]|nr:helix-turn-helix domain-containing protein [Paenibacillus contaminans]